MFSSIRSFIKVLLLLLLVSAGSHVVAQSYTASNIHAHNDYVNKNPFYEAYENGVGSIEADIFLVDNKLCVAHDRHEVSRERTLEKMYLIPLNEAIRKNSGSVYKDPRKELVLLIDLKAQGASALDALAALLKKFPDMVETTSLKFVISGDVPDTALWDKFPPYFYFDGRPSRTYAERRLERVGLISDSFTKYTSWRGTGPLPDADKKKIETVIRDAHAKDKKIRFWATADNETVWTTLMTLGVDLIGTDSVKRLSDFLQKRNDN